MPVTLDRGEAERLVHAYSDLILRLSYTYLCKDHLKSGWRRATVALDAAEAVPAPAEEEGSLLSAVNLLPPKYRTVIYLYYYEGYAAREIAQLLGEKPATVSTQLNRGRQQLRTLLESEGMT